VNESPDENRSSVFTALFQAPPRRLPDPPAWSVLDGLLLTCVLIFSQVSFHSLIHPFVAAESQWPTLIAAGGASAVTLALTFMFLSVRTTPGEGAASLICLRKPEGWGILPRALSPVLLGGALLFAVTQGQSALLELFEINPNELPAEPAVKVLLESESPVVTWTLIAFAVGLAPVTEEIIFRSVLYLPLRSKAGPLAAALIVSLAFASVHFYTWGLLHLFVIGMTLVAVFETTGTLLGPIVVHGAYNALAVAFVLTSKG
jgi:hypothetical protein